MTQEERIFQMQQTIDNLQYQIEQLTNRVARAELAAISINPIFTEEERIKAGQQLDSILLAERQREANKSELASKFL